LTEKFEGKIWVNFESFVMQMEKQCDHLTTKKCENTQLLAGSQSKKMGIFSPSYNLNLAGYVQLN